MPEIYLRAAQTSPAEDIWLYDTKADFVESLSVFMHSNLEIEGEATNDVILYSSNDWVPVAAPDLKLWLRADMAFANDSFGVPTWRDMSGNGKHATDTLGSNYQTFGVFGKDSMFVDAGNVFELPALLGTTGGPCTLAIVYRSSGTETTLQIVGWNGITGTNTVDVGSGNLMRTSFALSATGASSARVGHNYGADSRSHVDLVVFDGLAASTVPASYMSEVDGFMREELASSTLTNTITPGIFDTAHSSPAQIAEVLVYDRDLRGQYLVDLKAYLAARYVWKPTDLAATCMLWLRGDLGSQSATYWGDQSGNGKHATQVAGAPYEPSVGTVLINGKATARFAANAFYDIPVLYCGSAAWTQFVVYKLDSTLGASAYGSLLYWLDTNNSDASNVMFLAGSGTGYTPMVSLAEYTGTVAAVGYGTSATYDANPHIAQLTYDGGTNTSAASYTARQDWIGAAVSATGASVPVTGKIGGDGLGNGIIGEIAEIIVYDGVLSEADMLSVTEYLELRYNLVSTTGSGSGTIAPLVASGTGTQTAGGATGTGSGTLSPLVAASSGTETMTGTGSGTLSPLVAASSGSETFTGTGSGTLSPLVAASTGAETFTGTGSGVLSPLVASGAGAETMTGTGTGTLQPLVAASSGTETITGTGTGTLQPLVASGVGVERFTGTGSGTLSPLVASGTGAETFTGTGSGTLQPLVAAASGGETFTGTGSGTLAPLVATSSGTETFTGTGTCTISPLVATSTGTETIAGTGSGTLQPLDTSGSGSAGGAGVTGTGSGTLSPLVASASGTETFTGTGSGTIAPLVASSSGALSFVGTGSAALGPLVASGAGVTYVNVIGTGGAVLSSLTSSGAGQLVITGTGSASIAPLVALGFYVAAISGLSRVVLTRSSASVALTDSTARFTDSTSRPKVDLS